ncbi:MAG: phosphoglucosamine mutase [Burkholderiales bacterium]|jgi:phosphoglucosamine mutase|nr:phosphoglucosamine mutase [Burkholderiales bacterium]
MNKRNYFGTDGIRGRVGEMPMTPEFALKLGHAVGRVLAQQSTHHAGVLIGKDTRLSGYLIEAALEAGLSSAGVDVYLTGPLPTPGIAYLTRALRRSAGIVISASHNPFFDNGIKFFSESGTKLPDHVETQIEEALNAPLSCVAPDALGKAWRVDDAPGRYIEFCKSAFPNDLDLKGYRILVDCAHGAAYHTAPPVFHELGAQVTPLAAEPNGTNINEGVGAVHPEYLADQMRVLSADWGVALDGDGDRLIMADSAGRLYHGDALLYILARDMADRGLFKAGEGVVGTQMSNIGLEIALKKLGIPLIRAKVGDRYVTEQLLQHQWRVGGENSGHLLHLDHHTTGDAIIAALLVMRALVANRRDLSEATKDCYLYPQHLINLQLPSNAWRYRANPEESPIVAEALSDLKASPGFGRTLLRASGTEPVLRVMAEAETEAVAQRHAQQLADAVTRAMQQES